jgi:hypothetical protein
MSQLISRRKMLGGAVKTSVGLIVLKDLAFTPQSVIAFSRAAQATPNRFQAAYQRLDEYIARHMSEVGAPGMTLALASSNGLLRSSQYGFADVKAGVRVSPQTLFVNVKAFWSERWRTSPLSKRSNVLANTSR